MSEAAEPADERGRAEADRPVEARLSDGTQTTSQETPDHLSADLREQMLRDPRFTRLGWGAEPGVEEQYVAREAAQPVADAESDQSEETVTGRRVAEQMEDESSGAATDAEDNSGDPAEEAADVSVPFSVDTEVDSEPIKSRFDRWDPERLAMARPPKPEVSEADDVQPDDRTEGNDRRAEDERNGVAYIAASKDTRPWLAPAAECEPIVQSVYASIDQSDGHGHIRHGAMGSDEMQARRVAFNEDPAQPDPEKRALGVDGIDDSKQHYCGKDSTRVHDATALAAVYVMAAEHPEVRAVLDRPFDENVQPRDIAVPIAELLGSDGHEFCSGFTLKGWPEAKAARKEWLQVARAGGDLSEMPEPEVERIPTFEGGDIKIVFKRNLEAKRYGIYTLFPRPFEE
ncbi:hypothetical protein [Kribbella sindirgiensis]|uniref:Uncharacterized protein n=1 Tax=Kribbella sindirgiensis TaxID=1124744 RepID=A0A4R0JFT8_9ACTN|nr:hypothetical protein [Kribbella sindirgiensis]TCC43408.1 hypothetical protein E0H50_02760 [Kribbella sindirgiensis]